MSLDYHHLKDRLRDVKQQALRLHSVGALSTHELGKLYDYCRTQYANADLDIDASPHSPREPLSAQALAEADARAHNAWLQPEDK